MAELEREPAAVQSEAQGQARTGAEEAQARPTMDDMRFTKYDVFPMSRIRDPRVLRKSQGYQFYCRLCERLLKKPSSVDSHVKEKTHRIRAEDKGIARTLQSEASLLPPSPAQLGGITCAVERVFGEQSGLPQTGTREAIATQLEALLSAECPDVTVKLFGSSKSLFSLKSSNVNLFLDFPEEHVALSEAMLSTVKVLKANAKVYQKVKEDFFSYNKIPRILFEHSASSLQCEVRIMSSNPMTVSSLLRLYAELDQRALKLGLAFRYWAKVCGVDRPDQGHYPSHTFVLMVIHFLQQTHPPVLPVLHQMLYTGKGEGEGEGEERGGGVGEGGGGGDRVRVDIGKLTEVAGEWAGSSNTEELGSLWYQLLRYYARDFKMSVCGVSIRQLSPVLLKDRQWSSARIAVEDPLNPKSNVARSTNCHKVNEYLVSSIRKTFLYFAENGCSAAVAAPDQIKTETSSASLGGRDQSSLAGVGGEETDSSGTVGKVASCNACVDGGASEQENGQAIEAKDLERQLVDLSLCSKDPPQSSAGSAKGKGGGGGGGGGGRANVVPYSFSKKKFVYHECPEEGLPEAHDIPSSLPEPRCLKAISQHLITYSKAMSPTEYEVEQRHNICQLVLKDVQMLYPVADLQMFGSSVNGFGSPKSDLDLCLLLGGEYESKEEVIEKLAAMYRSKDFRSRYREVTAITSARVPIVKFFLNRWKLECDISLENVLHRVWRRQRNESCVGQLWLGLLRYYAVEFDWLSEVVSIRRLEPVTKLEKWWLSKPMAIEDPFNLDHNLANSVGTRMRLYIIERFQAALSYHSASIKWSCIEHLMDREVLVGDCRAPKFIICLRCNARGHKAANCPNRNRPSADVRQQELPLPPPHPPPHPPHALAPPLTEQSKVGGILRLPGAMPRGATSQRPPLFQQAVPPPTNTHLPSPQQQSLVPQSPTAPQKQHLAPQKQNLAPQKQPLDLQQYALQQYLASQQQSLAPQSPTIVQQLAASQQQRQASPKSKTPLLGQSPGVGTPLLQAAFGMPPASPHGQWSATGLSYGTPSPLPLYGTPPHGAAVPSYGTPLPASSYSTPPHGASYGTPPPVSSYSTPPHGASYGTPPPVSSYGALLHGAALPSYGTPLPASSYGAPPHGASYGAPVSSTATPPLHGSPAVLSYGTKASPASTPPAPQAYYCSPPQWSPASQWSPAYSTPRHTSYHLTGASSPAPSTVQAQGTPLLTPAYYTPHYSYMAGPQPQAQVGMVNPSNTQQQPAPPPDHAHSYHGHEQQGGGNEGLSPPPA